MFFQFVIVAIIQDPHYPTDSLPTKLLNKLDMLIFMPYIANRFVDNKIVDNIKFIITNELMGVKMDKLHQAHGNWVDGDRFWDREKEKDQFIEMIDDGANILLIAQRRMGKTSLMREVIRILNERYICLFVDLQKCESGADAIVELSVATFPHKSLWAKTQGLFSNVLNLIAGRIEKIGVGDLGITLRSGLTKGDWAERGDDLFRILAESDKPVLLMMDEVPIMVNRMLKGSDYSDYKITPERRSETDKFMSWLRGNLLDHKGKVRVVVSGSIGFEPILKQAGLSATIANLQPFELSPWDEETTIGCLHALAKNYGITIKDHAPLEIVKRLGCCIPHHVQMFFFHIQSWCKFNGSTEFGPDDVDEVYLKKMLSTRGHAELTHYEERLKLVLGEEAFPLAVDILTETAVSGLLNYKIICEFQKDYSFKDRTVEDAQKEILVVLKHDGYLEQNQDGFVFTSKLLRDWWKQRHSLFYTPVFERGAS